MTTYRIEDYFCGYCGGTGRAPSDVGDATIGAAAKAMRVEKRISQTRLADAMGMSNQYICDLEAGHRQWSPRLVQKYKDALAKAGAK